MGIMPSPATTAVQASETATEATHTDIESDITNMAVSSVKTIKKVPIGAAIAVNVRQTLYVESTDSSDTPSGVCTVTVQVSDPYQYQSSPRIIAGTIW